MTDTGILLNNEMDDFSAPDIGADGPLPPSELNFVRPRKRPLSSTCPSIAVKVSYLAAKPLVTSPICEIL